MNFWKTLRRVGHLVLAVLAVIAVLAAVVRNADSTDSNWNLRIGDEAKARAKNADTSGL
jgi:hypothetical protein